MQRTSSSSDGSRHGVACRVNETTLDTGADDARDDHESKRHKNSDDTADGTRNPLLDMV